VVSPLDAPQEPCDVSIAEAVVFVAVHGLQRAVERLFKYIKFKDEVITLNQFKSLIVRRVSKATDHMRSLLRCLPEDCYSYINTSVLDDQPPKPRRVQTTNLTNEESNDTKPKSDGGSSQEEKEEEGGDSKSKVVHQQQRPIKVSSRIALRRTARQGGNDKEQDECEGGEEGWEIDEAGGELLFEKLLLLRELKQNQFYRSEDEEEVDDEYDGGEHVNKRIRIDDGLIEK
jgi:hypothetical protein